MDRLPKLEMCCFCWSVEVGTKIIGWLQIVFGSLSFISSLASLATNKQSAGSGGSSEGADMMIESLGSALLGVLLIVGVMKKMRKLVLSWIVLELVFLVLAVIALIVTVVMLILFSSRGGVEASDVIVIVVVYVIVTVIFVALSMYFISVVASYYRDEFTEVSTTDDTEAAQQFQVNSDSLKQ